MMAITGRFEALFAMLRQHYRWLALTAVFVAAGFFLEREYRLAHADSANADRTQIYVSVKDEAAKPVPNASVELIGGDSKSTNESGLAKLNVGRHGLSRVRVSASGFKEAELSVQGSSIDPNKLIVLSPTSKEPTASDKQANSSDLEPYVETVRSGPQESGLGSEFSPWYQLISPIPKSRYVVVSWDYSLSGDRRCNEWSECRVTSSDVQVIFRFRMQGHNEWVPPHPGVSEGVLRVQYKPLYLLSNNELKAAINVFIGRTRAENTKMYDIVDRVARARDRLNYLRPGESPEGERYLKETEETLTNEMNLFVQQYVPAANQYLNEIERRLNSQEPLPQFSAAAGVGSLNTFTMRLSSLDTLAAPLK